MDLSIGIVGLPNVGKSTVFNALTKKVVPAENYPFCTIDPNVGIVEVADNRLADINNYVGSNKVVPAVVEFVDIAGLVRNAHKGDGLGNEFLANIRETNVILEVLRYFKDTNVTHVEKTVDPLRDKEIIETELILKDLDTLSKIKERLSKEIKFDSGKQKFFKFTLELEKHLNENKLAVEFKNNDQEIIKFRKQLFLLTDKQFIYLINGDWETEKPDLKNIYSELKINPQFKVVALNVKLEYELSQLTSEEADEFKKELGIEFTGLEYLTREAYSALNLISFFTAGEKEVRAWTIKKGMNAKQAAGVIHSDFERKFIAADVVAFTDFVACKGWAGSKEKGKVRLEGKDYIVADGDIMIFRHGS